MRRTSAWTLSSTIYALAAFASTTTPAVAQTAGDIFNLFGGIVQSAIVQTTLAEWRKLPQNKLACVDQTLRQRGSDLRTLIQQGTTPSDPRIAAMRSVCQIEIAQRPPTPTPSFNCDRINYRDELAICSSVELSQLDNAVAAGYEYVRRSQGDQFAKSIGGPLFQERRACGSDAACIKQQQIAAIKKYQSLGAPISDLSASTSNQIAQIQQLLWNYNGSTAYLVAQGRSRKFLYKEPRPEMMIAGAKSGSLIFEGETTGNQYEGTAYYFHSHCRPLPYLVSGPILDNDRRVELIGLSPRLDNDCHIIEYVEELLSFQLIEPKVATSSDASKMTENLAQPTASPESTGAEQPTKPAAGVSAALLSQSEINALRARLMALWYPPVDIENPDKFVIRIRIRLGRDGSLSSPPIVLTSGTGPPFNTARDSAIRAVLLGQPYDMFKPENYETWKEMEVTFDPRDLKASPDPAATDDEATKRTCQQS